MLFDVDDTLYEVAHLVRQSWLAHAADLAELDMNAAALVAAYDACRYRRTIPAALGLALTTLGYPAELAARVHQISQGYTPDRLPAQTGVVELLATIRGAGVKTGVVTNGDPARQRAKLTALGLADAFDVVVVCDGDTVPHKPHPAGFTIALTVLGVPAAETLMVGDRIDNDIAPALTLGMRAARLRVGNHAAAEGEPCVVEDEDPARVWSAVLGVVGVPT